MSTGRGILRRFNDAGIAEFVRRIETLRAGGAAEIGDAFVNEEKLTEPIVPEVQLERPAFETKRDAGAYLSERTRAARTTYGDDDRGLWTWLSAWHWDAVCPVREDGQRKVLNPVHYVLGYGYAQNSKQHLLRAAIFIFEAWPTNKLLLDSPTWSLTRIVQDVTTRLFLARLRGMGELVDMLYRDPVTGKQKPGAVDAHVVRAGNLSNRLPARIRQLEVTHDLTNLTAEQLLNLLGDEFRQWAVASTGPEQPRRVERQRSFFPPPPPAGVSGQPPS
jgi:hypothetical protein